METPATATTLLDADFMRKIEQLTLISRKIFNGRMKGERRSRKKGISVEFADYRNYVPGDDLRFIDWNIYARLDRLFLKLFQEEEDLHVYILVDISGSMSFGKPDKLAYARQVAAALAYVGLVNLDRVVVGSFSSRIRDTLPPLRGRSQVWKLLRFLSGLHPEGTTRLERSVRDFVVRHRRRGIVIFISDFFDRDGFEGALKLFLARNLDIFTIQILAPEEVDPKLTGDLRLVDMEDGEVTEVTISAPLLKVYSRNLQAFLGDIRDYCSRRGIMHVFTTTTAPFDKLILNYLRTRGLLR
ncbi:MAG: DUF58 domain-containing protein [Planctomycetota bacterium]|nr:DUF58 domain-containing protein [Planctomycetota bacterium]